MLFSKKQLLMASNSPERIDKQEERRRNLLASRWYYKPLQESVLNVPVNVRFYDQLQYEDIPLSDSSKKDDSTVATSGSAILVARFCGKYFVCKEQPSIEELAKMSVDLGYINYTKANDGTWSNNNGISPEFFDRFLPGVYGLISRRLTDIDYVREAIKDGRLVIFQVEDSLNRVSVTSKKEHYIAVVGDDEKGFFVYDPIYTSIQHMRHNKVFKALIDAWVIYEI